MQMHSYPFVKRNGGLKYVELAERNLIFATTAHFGGSTYNKIETIIT